MIKMKSSYNILGLKVKVNYINGVNENGFMGYFDPNINEIFIYNHINENELLKTLYHELWHAISERIGLHRTNIDANIHEMIADGFSNFLIDQKRLSKKRKKPSTKKSDPSKKR